MREVRHHHQVLLAGEQLVHRRELPSNTDRGAHQAGLPDHLVTGYSYHAGIRRQEGGEDPHGGGLARPVRPQQREHRSLDDIEVDTVEHHLVAERFADPSGLGSQGGTTESRRSHR